MSEQQPLLPSQDAYADTDVENTAHGRQHHWKKRMAEFLESRPMHYTVLTLARIYFYI